MSNGPNLKVLVEPKAPQQSKTVWLNSVVLALSIVFAIASGADLIEPVPAEYSGWVSAAVAVINVLLRIFATSAPITLR